MYLGGVIFFLSLTDASSPPSTTATSTTTETTTEATTTTTTNIPFVNRRLADFQVHKPELGSVSSETIDDAGLINHYSDLPLASSSSSEYQTGFGLVSRNVFGSDNYIGSGHGQAAPVFGHFQNVEMPEPGYETSLGNNQHHIPFEIGGGDKKGEKDVGTSSGHIRWPTRK